MDLGTRNRNRNENGYGTGNLVHVSLCACSVVPVTFDPDVVFVLGSLLGGQVSPAGERVLRVYLHGA